MSSVEISSTSVERVTLLWLQDGAPVTGGAPTMRVRRASDNFTTVLDWDAERFVDPATAIAPSIQLNEVSATTDKGAYFWPYDAAFPSNAVAPDVYAITFYADATLNSPLGRSEIRVGTVDTINTVSTRTDVATSTRAVPGSAMTLSDGALLPAKIGAGFVTAMQSGLALEATLTDIKGASFSTGTDSLRAIRVLVSALPTTTAPTAAENATAVWAKAWGTPDAGTYGWMLYRLGQWGTEIAQKRIVGQNLLLQSIGGGTTYATVPLKDVDGGVITPGVGDPAQYLPGA